MKRLTMTTSVKPPGLGIAIKELGNRKGSPCIECLVKATCARSFVDKSVCDKFAMFIQMLMIKAGMKFDENKD